jgi:hypothetical protein
MAELAKINHPNIMGYYGYEKNEIGLFFFVEFCSGGSLKQLITKKISELKVITLYRQLLDAMSYINKLSTTEFIQTNCIAILNLTICCLTKTKSWRLLISDWLVMCRSKWRRVRVLRSTLLPRCWNYRTTTRNVTYGVQVCFCMRC